MTMYSPTVRRIVGPTILLSSGEYFDFENPEGSVFTIEDVAHALSHVCRFAGHCRRFYSVAQHSVHVSEQIEPEHAMAGLLHDAVEAFVGDVTKPLKDMLPAYKAIEHRIEAAVLERFGLPAKLPPQVKVTDIRMLATEQRQLMGNHDNWAYTRDYPPFDMVIPHWSSVEAKAAFLARYAMLAARQEPTS